jgi:hypothetical protein
MANSAPNQRSFRFVTIENGIAGVTLVALVVTVIRCDSVSRFSRLRSARSSAADWQRISRSFSSALLTIRFSSAGTSGFKSNRSYGSTF